MTDNDTKYNIALRLLDETREELARAEGKASFLLGAATVALGIVAAALTSANGWDPSDLTSGYRTVFWVGIALVAGGVVLLGLVVYPAVRLTRAWFWARQVTMPTQADDSADYFADLAQAKTLTDATARITATSARACDRTVRQAWVLSHLAVFKYALTRWSFRLFAASAVLIVAALIDGQ